MIARLEKKTNIFLTVLKQLKQSLGVNEDWVLKVKDSEEEVII